MMVVLAWLAVVALAWAPFFWCCCDTSCTTTVTVTVTGCSSAALSGVTVSITGTGVTSDTDTTNGSGVVVLTPISSSGVTGTLTVTGPAGYADSVTSVTLDCTSKSVFVTLIAASGYSCTDDTCCPEGGTAPYLIPTFPTTLYFNDSIGSVTMTKVGGGGVLYRGCASRTSTLATDCVDPISTGTGSVNVNFEIQCSGGTWTVAVSFEECVAFGTCVGLQANSGCTSITASGGGSLSGGSCNPTFALTGSMSGPPFGSKACWNSVYGTAASVSVSLAA